MGWMLGIWGEKERKKTVGSIEILLFHVCTKEIGKKRRTRSSKELLVALSSKNFLSIET
jgi:hypothetical protein